MLKIRTMILADEVPLNENGFHWRSKGKEGVIYYIENGKMLPIYTEVPNDTEKCDIVVFGQTKHLRYWKFPEEKHMSDTEANEIHKKLIKWLAARRWKNKII